MVRYFYGLHRQLPELSFAEIAAAMSAEFQIQLTRNACIGKARRLGLPMRDAVKTARKPVNGKVIKLRLRPVDAPIEPQEESRPDQPEGLDIYQLRENDCRWPLGSITDRPPYRFCGAQTELGRSWCVHHAEIAYSKPAKNWI
jgi:GcrA cell cycle regulator